MITRRDTKLPRQLKQLIAITYPFCRTGRTTRRLRPHVRRRPRVLARPRVRPRARVWSRTFALLLLGLLAAVVLAACAPGETPPAAICDTYDRALFTTQ